jgi:hypothetical protein
MNLRLTVAEAQAARASLRRLATERASDQELAGIADELGFELALLQGDLAADDYSLFDERTLRSTIAFYEHDLAAVTKQAERRLRSRRYAQRHPGRDPHEDFRARFAAMRLTDIVDAIQSLGTPLQKRSREWWGLCPFHPERTPSFAVNTEKGVWRCHGCQRGGDLVAFDMRQQHLNAVEALRFLEEIVNVPGVAA